MQLIDMPLMTTQKTWSLQNDIRNEELNAVNVRRFSYIKLK